MVDIVTFPIGSKAYKCPFCGSNDACFDDDYAELWAVYCNSCYANGPMKKSKEEAIASWNVPVVRRHEYRTLEFYKGSKERKVKAIELWQTTTKSGRELAVELGVAPRTFRRYVLGVSRGVKEAL